MRSSRRNDGAVRDQSRQVPRGEHRRPVPAMAESAKASKGCRWPVAFLGRRDNGLSASPAPSALMGADGADVGAEEEEEEGEEEGKRRGGRREGEWMKDGWRISIENTGKRWPGCQDIGC